MSKNKNSNTEPLHKLPVEAEEKVGVEPVQEVVDGSVSSKEGQVVDIDGTVFTAGVSLETKTETDTPPTEEASLSDKIRAELNALKAALIEKEAVSEELGEEQPETYSKVHAMHEELGMAGSRNAFPIQKDKAADDRLGQRKGMFIGLPNRHHRKHLKPASEKLGEGVFKIDNSRPVNN